MDPLQSPRTLPPVNVPATIRSFVLLAAATTGVAAQTVPVQVAKPLAPGVSVSRKPKPKPKPHTYQPPWNPNVILLDPAHGGADDGANLGSAGVEKDFDVAFAERLRGLLAAQNFNVVLTHTAAADDIAPDSRVEIANRSHAVACLLLHASNAGHGVHLFTSSLSELASATDAQPETYIAPWDSAQAASLPRSQQLVNELATSLNGQNVPLVVGRVSVRPIDSMFCPAVAVEIAPEKAGVTLSDDNYLRQVAESIVTALTYWRQHAQDEIATAQAATQQTTAPAPSPGTPAAVPKPKSKPKPVVVPEGQPVTPATTRPAPVVRRPAPVSPPVAPTPPAVPQ